jgi:hypothetical protein
MYKKNCHIAILNTFLKKILSNSTNYSFIDEKFKQRLEKLVIERQPIEFTLFWADPIIN